MAPADRLNLLADSWALVEAGRAPPASFFELVEEIGSDDSRAIWGFVIRVFRRLDQLERGRPERAAFQAYARGKLRSVIDRPNQNGPDNEDQALLRARLLRALGELDDPDMLAGAKQRFEVLQKDRTSVSPELRDPVTYLAGLAADRKTYAGLITLARQTTDTAERVRYYLAAASARDPALAAETLELTLTEELPSNLIGAVINAVAWSGEQPELALAFVLKNFEALANKQGPAFRNTFVSNLMMVFADAARVEELKAFAPAQATSGGRVVAERAQETIMISAEFKANTLPAVDEWIKRRARD